MDHLTWILVADTVKARIYSAHKVKLFSSFNGKDLTLVSEHAHEASRKRDIELKSDKHGKFGSGTFIDPTDPQYHEAEVFSQELSKVLESSRNQNSYKDLIMIAPPVFMGLLNKHISKAIDKLVSLRLEKNYTNLNEQQLVSQLQEHL